LHKTRSHRKKINFFIIVNIKINNSICFRHSLLLNMNSAIAGPQLPTFIGADLHRLNQKKIESYLSKKVGIRPRTSVMCPDINKPIFGVLMYKFGDGEILAVL